MKFFLSILFIIFFNLSCQCQKQLNQQNNSDQAGSVEIPAQQLLETVKEDELNSFFKDKVEQAYKEKYHGYFIRMYERLLKEHPENSEYQRKLKEHQDAVSHSP